MIPRVGRHRRAASPAQASGARSDETVGPGIRRYGGGGPALGRACIGAVVLLALGLALAGCGRKGPPQPPPGVPDTYPRVYPHA
jgi:hypothetical protein